MNSKLLHDLNFEAFQRLCYKESKLKFLEKYSMEDKEGGAHVGRGGPCWFPPRNSLAFVW